MQNEVYAKEVEEIRAAVLDLWKLQDNPMVFGQENQRNATIEGHIKKLESYAKNKPAMKFTSSSIEPDNVSLSSNDYNMLFEEPEPEPKGWSSKNPSGLRPGHRTDDPNIWEWEGDVPNSRWEGGGRRTKKAKKAKRARKTKRLYKKI